MKPERTAEAERGGRPARRRGRVVRLRGVALGVELGELLKLGRERPDEEDRFDPVVFSRPNRGCVDLELLQEFVRRHGG